MNIAAYCRVSTDKADQLNSLEAQKEFFAEYTKRTGDNLVRLYADEGISGAAENIAASKKCMGGLAKNVYLLVILCFLTWTV